MAGSVKERTTVTLDRDTKAAATPILESLGFNLSSYLEIALRQLVRERGLPFKPTLQVTQARDIYFVNVDSDDVDRAEDEMESWTATPISEESETEDDGTKSGETAGHGTRDDEPRMTVDDLDPTTLYDIFYEAGTRLGGVYVALWDKAEREGDMEAVQRWKDASIAMEKERASVDPDDLDSQKAHILSWSDECKRLEAML